MNLFKSKKMKYDKKPNTKAPFIPDARSNLQKRNKYINNIYVMNTLRVEQINLSRKNK